MSNTGCPLIIMCCLMPLSKNLKNFHAQQCLILTLYIWLAAAQDWFYKAFYVWVSVCEQTLCVLACAHDFICMFSNACSFCACLLDWENMLFWNAWECVWGCVYVSILTTIFYLTVCWFMQPHSYSKCCSLVCVTTQPFCYRPNAATL